MALFFRIDGKKEKGFDPPMATLIPISGILDTGAI